MISSSFLCFHRIDSRHSFTCSNNSVSSRSTRSIISLSLVIRHSEVSHSRLSFMMPSNTEGRTGSTTSSTDSAQGSGSLSDAFVVVKAGGGSVVGSTARVEAPEGSAQFHIRRSARVASSRSHSMQASASGPSVTGIVDALPGRKRKVGYAYQVLESVTEQAGPSLRIVIPAGKGGNSRGATTPQLGPTPGSRKRSATSAAPGSGRRGPTPKRLASAADFSPTHFDEPVSDAPIPPLYPTHQSITRHPSPHSNLPSPTRPEPAQVDRVVTPFSSPISQNPLLRRDTPMNVQTPSPRQRRVPSFRTQDPNAAWAAAEGLSQFREASTPQVMCQLKWWEALTT